jgi:hypothetical protein
MKRILLGLALVSLLTGCSSPTPSPSSSPTKTKTQAQIETEFLKIASDSCAKAQSENIVESVADGSKIIALAKANAYKDYSAVYIDNKGATQVIYELELTVCGPGYLISMMEEANHDNSGDYEHHIKQNSDGTYTWTQHSYGTENALEDTIFTVESGLITAAKTPAYDYSFSYGPVSDSDMEIFRAAIDAELERLNQ